MSNSGASPSKARSGNGILSLSSPGQASGCAQWRAAHRLMALRRQLRQATLTQAQRIQALAEIAELESELGVD